MAADGYGFQLHFLEGGFDEGDKPFDGGSVEADLTFGAESGLEEEVGLDADSVGVEDVDFGVGGVE